MAATLNQPISVQSPKNNRRKATLAPLAAQPTAQRSSQLAAQTTPLGGATRCRPKTKYGIEIAWIKNRQQVLYPFADAVMSVKLCLTAHTYQMSGSQSCHRVKIRANRCHESPSTGDHEFDLGGASISLILIVYGNMPMHSIVCPLAMRVVSCLRGDRSVRLSPRLLPWIARPSE